MQLGRDAKTLILMSAAVALLGWLSHIAMRPAAPPPSRGAPLHGRSDERPWGNGRPHGPHDERRGSGPPPRGEVDFTPIRPDDPLLAEGNAPRFSPDAVFTMRVDSDGKLCVGQGGPNGRRGGRRFAKEARFTFDRHDGDLVEAERHLHVLPRRRIPPEATACAISPNGLLLAWRQAPGDARETAFSCGYIEIATFSVVDALEPDLVMRGWWRFNENTGNVCFGRPGTDGRGSLIITP